MIPRHKRGKLSTPSSALVTEMGKRVLFRIGGRFFELGQNELRALLGLPAGPSGLGITIDRERFRFEFAADDQAVEITAKQLYRRLALRAIA